MIMSLPPFEDRRVPAVLQVDDVTPVQSRAFRSTASSAFVDGTDTRADSVVIVTLVFVGIWPYRYRAWVLSVRSTMTPEPDFTSRSRLGLSTEAAPVAPMVTLLACVQAPADVLNTSYLSCDGSYTYIFVSFSRPAGCTTSFALRAPPSKPSNGTATNMLDATPSTFTAPNRFTDWTEVVTAAGTTADSSSTRLLRLR